MRLLTLALVASATLSPVLAGDVRVTVTGSVVVSSPSPTQGPFAGTVAGDPVTLVMEVSVPGVVVNPNQFEQYALDTSASTLTIWNVSDHLGAANLSVFNAFPIADSLRLMNAPLAGGGRVTCELSEQTGALFTSTDLTQNLGTWPVSVFGSYNFMLTGNGGYVEIVPIDLTIEQPSFGVSYCAPIRPNSTGATGEIVALGTDVLASNALRLRAQRLPLNAFGFFICSRTQGYTAVNAAGSILCVGGAIGRFVGPGQIANSGASGVIELVPDLTQLPSPTGFVAAAVGETWNFQAWHRDASATGAADYNFTNGVAVTLQ